jgi:hypothetical protein
VNISLFLPKKLISVYEDMEIKKNAASTLFLEFFCQFKFSCQILKIQKIQKSTPPPKLSSFISIQGLTAAVWAVTAISSPFPLAAPQGG